MEQNIQKLLREVLRQIFIKKIENPACTSQEGKPTILEEDTKVATIATFVIPGPALSAPFPEEYYHSLEYLSRLRKKMRIGFTQAKEFTVRQKDSFEKRFRLNKINDALEEVILVEYSGKPLAAKIARMEELLELYLDMVRSGREGY